MNKIILIIWASSGIWQATAIELANAWYKNIIIHYYKNLEWIKQTEKDLKKLWAEPFVVNWNIWNYLEIDDFMKKIMDKYWTLDIVINNAWELWPYDNLENIKIEEQENLMRANLFWPIYISQKVMKVLKEQNKKWHILFTSSIHWNPDKWWEEKCIPYCISKAWINNLVWIWARDLSPNIRINAIALWIVDTPIWDEDTEESKKYFIDRTLIKKWIKPEEIAKWFLFLIENEAITWEVMYINGGFRP